MPSTAALVRRLARLASQFGPDVAAAKKQLLDQVARRRMTTLAQVRRLHEVLSLWHAYPDDAEVLERVTAALARFGARADVRHFKDALENSGIAGTDIVYPFGAPTAQWLAAEYPDRLTVAWDRIADPVRISRHLLLLARAAEVPGYDDPPIADAAEWARRLAGPATDATFIVRGTAALEAGTLVRDAMYNELDLPLCVASGDAPTRTGTRWEGSPIEFRRTPLDHRRPDLRQEIGRAPQAIRDVTRPEAERLIHLAHEAMVTRERDLDAFASGDPADVRVVNWEDGLQFACLGVQPERRFLLEAVYAFLTLQNGVPIGYALASGLFGSSEVAYNVFETFRGGEAARVYARLLATVRTLFASDTFAIYPYQLGHENEEGLASGAWWFYYKLGFRPRERSIAGLVAREARRVASRADYRTPRSTLERLVAHPVFLATGGDRDDVIGVMPVERVGLAVTDTLAARFGTDRVDADRALAREAAAALGDPDLARWSEGERLFWQRWAPLVAILPGLKEWTSRDRTALVDAIRAKGSRRESDAVTLLTAHAPLRVAVSHLLRRSAIRSP